MLETSASELSSIRSKLKVYRDTTLQKEDQSKFTTAVQNVHAASNLTELTMLALKITEEMKRAEENNTDEIGTSHWHCWVNVFNKNQT